MPAQLSTILYISDYQEKTSSGFFIGTAIGYARLDEDDDTIQMFNITVFYPHDDELVCHVPRLEVGQVLSVANSKFCRGPENQIDVSINYLFFYCLFSFYGKLQLIFHLFIDHYNSSCCFKY